MSDPVAVRAYVGLGANLGQPRAQLLQALEALAAEPDIAVVAVSRFYRTAPVDAQGPDFLNAVVALDCRLTAPALLRVLQRLEQLAHRERPYRNAPRTLDLDLLLFGDHRIDTPELTVPHPRGLQRAFVLQPLADLAPALVWPGTTLSVAEALRHTQDQVLEVVAP